MHVAKMGKEPVILCFMVKDQVSLATLEKLCSEKQSLETLERAASAVAYPGQPSQDTQQLSQPRGQGGRDPAQEDTEQRQSRPALLPRLPEGGAGLGHGPGHQIPHVGGQGRANLGQQPQLQHSLLRVQSLKPKNHHWIEKYICTRNYLALFLFSW